MGEMVTIRRFYGHEEMIFDSVGNLDRIVWHHNPNLNLSREEQQRLKRGDNLMPCKGKGGRKGGRRK